MAKSDKRSARRRGRTAKDRQKESTPTLQADARPDPGISESFTILGMLTVLVMIAYSNGLYGDFVFDDHPIVIENPLVHSLTQIPRLFTAGY